MTDYTTPNWQRPDWYQPYNPYEGYTITTTNMDLELLKEIKEELALLRVEVKKLKKQIKKYENRN